jgi:hypothetical protein
MLFMGNTHYFYIFYGHIFKFAISVSHYRRVSQQIFNKSPTTGSPAAGGTPLAGIAPADLQVSFGVCVQEDGNGRRLPMGSHGMWVEEWL